REKNIGSTIAANVVGDKRCLRTKIYVLRVMLRIVRLFAEEMVGQLAPEPGGAALQVDREKILFGNKQLNGSDMGQVSSNSGARLAPLLFEFVYFGEIQLLVEAVSCYPVDCRIADVGCEEAIDAY